MSRYSIKGAKKEVSLATVQEAVIQAEIFL